MFPSDWFRLAALTIQSSLVAADLVAFPVLFTEANLPLEMLTTGGTHAAQADGGDVRFSYDPSGVFRIACELVVWTQNADPTLAKAEVWVPVDLSALTDTTIYVWYSAGGGQTQPAANAPYGSQDVWDADYSAVYHLQTIGAAAAGTTPDATSNANDLTNSGSNVTAVTAKIGKGGSFAGNVTAYELVRTSGITNVPIDSDARTLECWFKRNANANDQVLFGWGGNGTDRHFCIYWTNDGHLYCDCVNVYARFVWVADTNWHHVAFTLPLGGNLPDIVGYLDGIPQTMTNSGLNTGIVTRLGEIRMSGLPEVPAPYYFDGLLDEGRISKAERSMFWIETQFNNQSSPATFTPRGVVTTMSIAAAQPAINTLLKFGDQGSPESFNTVANVGDLNEILSMTSDTADVTSHSTGVPWSQIIPTILNGGKVTFPLFFIPSSGAPSGGVIGHNNTAGILKYFTQRGASSTQSGTPINMKVVFPDAAATTYTFTGFITAFKVKSPVKSVLTADMEISVTSAPTLV